MSTNHTTIPTLPRLVCLVGRSHELRQELAARLSQAHSYTDVNITPIIREYAALVFPDADLDEAPDATEGVPLWEAFGAVCARLEPSVWVEPWRQAVEHELETGGRVICTDARDPATLALAGQLGGTRVLLGSALPDTVSQERFEWICEHPGQGADLFEHLVEHLRTPARHEHAPPRHCDTKRGPERELARSLESAQQTWTALAACLRAWAEDPAARARTQARREELERAHRQACLELGERYLAAQMARGEEEREQEPLFEGAIQSGDSIRREETSPPEAPEEPLARPLHGRAPAVHLDLAPKTAHMIEALPGLLERLEASSGYHREERELLEWAQEPEVMDGWQRLPDRVVEKLLHHIAARARAWQAQMGIATREPTRAFVSRLFSCAHSLKDRMDLGFIHGMSFKHTPKHAPSWGEEATYWLRQLNEELSPRAPRGDSGSAPRSSSCVCEAGAGEDEGALRELVIPEEWPLLHYTRERRVVVLGGTRRPECEALLEQELRCEIEWIEQSHSSGTRALERLGQRIERGSVDLLILLRQYMGHDTTPHVVRPAKAGDVPMVFVEHGYGIEQIRQAMMRHLDAPS